MNKTKSWFFEKIKKLTNLQPDSSRKKILINTNTWRLNKTFLNNQQVTEKIKREIRTFLERNDNENMTTQNLWDAAKAVLRGTFIALQPTPRNKKNIKQTT